VILPALDTRFTFHEGNRDDLVRAFKAFEAGERRIYLVVYHGRRHRAAVRAWGTGFQPTPWRCPRCGKDVTHPDDLRYAVASLPTVRRRRVAEGELDAAVMSYAEGLRR